MRTDFTHTHRDITHTLTQTDVTLTHTDITRARRHAWSLAPSHPGMLQHPLSFQQAKKGLLTLTVRTRLTAPHCLSSHLSPPLCRSLSSSTCVSRDSSCFVGAQPAAPASTAKPSYRVMVEVSLRKGRSLSGAPPPLTGFPHGNRPAQRSDVSEQILGPCLAEGPGLCL